MTYDFRMKPGKGTAPKPMLAVAEDAWKSPAYGPAYLLCGAHEVSFTQIFDAILGMHKNYA